jgi:hypothetical protein
MPQLADVTDERAAHERPDAGIRSSADQRVCRGA